jgi:hypothetical protein
LVYAKLIDASASWVGDSVAWVTDTRQAWLGPQMMLSAPNGPLLTVNCIVSCPLASEVTLCMFARSQSPGPVAAPLAAHSVRTRDSPGEKPAARTNTVWGDFSPLFGITVTVWVVAAGAVVAGAVVRTVLVTAGAVVVGPSRVTGLEPLEHPAPKTTSTTTTTHQNREDEMFISRHCPGRESFFEVPTSRLRSPA